MIKRILVFGLSLLLLGGLVYAEAGFQSIAATATSQTATVGGHTVLIINDSTSYSVYVRVFNEGETAAAATTSYIEIKKGEGIEFTRETAVSAVSLICATSQSATVRLIYW